MTNPAFSPSFNSPRRDRNDLIKFKWFQWLKRPFTNLVASEGIEPVFDQEQPEFPCDHEWDIINDSFDHEYGTELIFYERCCKCDTTRDHEPFYYGDECL